MYTSGTPPLSSLRAAPDDAGQALLKVDGRGRVAGDGDAAGRLSRDWVFGIGAR